MLKRISEFKHWDVVLIIIIGIVLLTPIRGYIQSFFLVSDETGTVLNKTNLDIQLKGINVPDDNLKNFEGQTIFLNFWGTWCPPCVKEMPSIQKLYDSKKGQMVFVLIAMRDNENKIKKFLSENKYNMPVYIATSPIEKTIKPGAFPTTYIIDKKGKIAFQYTGELDWTSPETISKINSVIK